MNVQKNTQEMLDLIIQPGFCVKDNKLTHVNTAAKGLFLAPGMEISAMLPTGREAYEAFQGGCLYLTLELGGRSLGASVIRMEDGDVFLIEEDAAQRELRSLALAARELREPLSSIMTGVDRLTRELDPQENPELREQSARLNRGLYQMLRILGNMSDAGQRGSASRQQIQDIGSFMDEIFEKAKTLLSHTGIKLEYEELTESILCLADQELLERAVLNILSNSVKFTPAGGTIRASFTRRSWMLQLQIQDSGSGIAQDILGNVFYRYLRQPAIEDSRFGLGLGMVMIRSAAASHGGTVLIDQPEGTGTRITLTLAIRQNGGNMLRSNVLRVDYAGELDHGLVELADCLPSELYEK